MADLTVRFDLTFGKRSLKCILSAIMMAMVATELGSETITLTTYYPAPSGIYNQMITTGNTTLARDGNSSVGIRTSNPNPSYALDVLGNAHTRNLYLDGIIAIGDTSTVPMPTPKASMDANGDGHFAGSVGVGGNLTVNGSISLGGVSKNAWPQQLTAVPGTIAGACPVTCNKANSSYNGGCHDMSAFDAIWPATGCKQTTENWGNFMQITSCDSNAGWQRFLVDTTNGRQEDSGWVQSMFQCVCTQLTGCPYSGQSFTIVGSAN